MESNATFQFADGNATGCNSTAFQRWCIGTVTCAIEGLEDPEPAMALGLQFCDKASQLYLNVAAMTPYDLLLLAATILWYNALVLDVLFAAFEVLTALLLSPATWKALWWAVQRAPAALRRVAAFAMAHSVLAIHVLYISGALSLYISWALSILTSPRFSAPPP